MRLGHFRWNDDIENRVDNLLVSLLPDRRNERHQISKRLKDKIVGDMVFVGDCDDKALLQIEIFQFRPDLLRGTAECLHAGIFWRFHDRIHDLLLDDSAPRQRITVIII